MLTRFGVTNFGPFKDAARIDLRAVRSIRDHSRAVLYNPRGDALLKVAAIYGANASGKSSLITAMKCFRVLITGAREGACPLADMYRPYLFSEATREVDTEYEAYFRADDLTEYHYGFTHDARRVKMEYLYRKNPATGRVSVLFERDGQEYRFGKAAGGMKRAGEAVGEDCLAMPRFAAVAPGKACFQQAYALASALMPIGCMDGEAVPGDAITRLTDEQLQAMRPDIRRFLQCVDAGISDIVIKNVSGQPRVFAVHITEDGQSRDIPLTLESDGIKRMLSLFLILRRVRDLHGTLAFDELNMQLHPLMTKFVVDLFCTEGMRAQLIYTTHDTSILDDRYFRPDQIWFVEKERAGRAQLYSLAEFRRLNPSAYKEDYLGGAFGAIPALRAFEWGEGAREHE